MNVLLQVARKNNTNICEVEKEINNAIKIAVKCQTPFWQELFPAGQVPTAEQLIAVLISKARG